MKRLAARMHDIQAFRVMDILARAKTLERQGRSIVHMGAGEPDFTTPEPILQAGKVALDSGLTHYTPAVGLMELREAIANFYMDRYGVSINPEQVIVTPGASGALMLAMGVIINPGDQVLMADPGYPCNRHFVRLMEGEAVSVPVTGHCGYQLNAEIIEKYYTTKTSAVILASPSNPTGSLIAHEELIKIVEFAEHHDMLVIMDEIYHGLVYGGSAQTAVGLSNNVFVINSFSKYFCMTGWRLGWIVAPMEYVDDLDKLAQNIFLAAPTLAQNAALAAFKPETIKILDQRREIFKQRRDFLLPALRQLGFEITTSPQGAFYIYANCHRLSDNSAEFSRQLLEQAGVAITPGIDFGHYLANQHVRFAYTTSLEKIEEGVDRIKTFMQKSL